MGWKSIRYRHHALRRMQERHITRLEVRIVLARGARRRQPSGVWVAEAEVGRRTLRVPYLEGPRHILVLTAIEIGVR